VQFGQRDDHLDDVCGEHFDESKAFRALRDIRKRLGAGSYALQESFVFLVKPIVAVELVAASELHAVKHDVLL
jgi:hypothetical protein